MCWPTSTAGSTGSSTPGLRGMGSNRRSSPASRAGRRSCVRAPWLRRRSRPRSGAPLASPVAPRGAPTCAGAAHLALCAARPPAARGGRSRRATRRRSISAACWLGAPSRARLDLSPSGDLVEAAANLFAHLRALDATGASTIAVAPIPALAVSARRSTIACGGPQRPVTAERRVCIRTFPCERACGAP